jgi:methyl-accepting chemotaxis protein
MNKKMKSIKTKLSVFTIALVTIIIAGISFLSIRFASDALHKTVARNMEAVVDEGAKTVESRVSGQLSIVETLASSEFLTDSTLTAEQKLAKFAEAIQKNSYIKMGIVDTEGNAIYSNGNTTEVADRDYFINAMKGQANVSDPLMSRSEGIIVVIYSVPIMQDGKVVGVLTATKDGNDISGIVNDITFGDTGKAFMINKDGVKIAHYKSELVTEQDNDLTNVEKDPALRQLANLETKMIKGESGTGFYHYDGVDKFLAYSPVNSTSWSLAVTVEKTEIYKELNNLINVLIILAVAFLVIAVSIAFFFASSISKRIRQAITYIRPIADGDFTVQIEEKHLGKKDEIGQMIESLSYMQNSMKGMLKAVINNSQKIDEDAQSLSAVSQQLSASSNVMADSIEGVAKGTVAQAESLAAITESINVFGSNIDHITQDIRTVDNHARDIERYSETSNANMNNLAKSVEATNASFQTFESGVKNLGINIDKINEITGLINSISEQTNLLSLNAAIEAARAGESGRGFAVVADEIRQLADQSRQSSQNIANLISDVHKVSVDMIQTTNTVSKEFSEQTEVIHSTIESFQHIMNAVEEIIPKIDTVNASTNTINTEKNEIMGKIEDISAISEETSASSEEISASTEEIASSSQDVAQSATNLGNRTQVMMTEVSKFKL